MIQTMSNEEKQRISTILFGNGRESVVSVRQTTDPEDRKKLQSILAQKIAYESIREDDHAPDEPSVMKKVCFCFFPETYANYFDTTTQLFLKRCAGTLLFWRGDFLNIGNGKFELYGPMWIAITYACILSISANMASLHHLSYENFKFNADYVARAFTVVFALSLLIPLALGFIVKIMKGDMPILASLCIWGYGLLWFIIPTAACIIPSLFWQVGMLSLGAFFNTIFLLRNYHTYAGKDLQSNVYLLHICIISFEVLYVLAIKYAFFSKCKTIPQIRAHPRQNTHVQFPP